MTACSHRMPPPHTQLRSPNIRNLYCAVSGFSQSSQKKRCNALSVFVECRQGTATLTIMTVICVRCVEHSIPVEVEQTKAAGAADPLLRLWLRPGRCWGRQGRQSEWLRQDGSGGRWRRQVEGRSARLSSLCAGQRRWALRTTDRMPFQRLLHTPRPQRT